MIQDLTPSLYLAQVYGLGDTDIRVKWIIPKAGPPKKLMIQDLTPTANKAQAEGAVLRLRLQIR